MFLCSKKIDFPFTESFQVNLLEFPQNVISKRIYCSEVPICLFFESLRMAVLKIEALE